jgi:hypothetical protein
MSAGRDDENNKACVSSVSKTSLQAQMLRRFSNQSVFKLEGRIIKPPIARDDDMRPWRTFDLRDTGNRGKEHTGNKRRPGTSGMNNKPFQLFMKDKHSETAQSRPKT